MLDSIKGVLDWEFLDEPAYRWFLFLGVLFVMLIAWNRILRALA